MGSKKAKNKKKNELKLIFFIILVSAVLFVLSTYAWFSTQRNVSITNLAGEVQVAEGLEISLDAKTWSNSIVLHDKRDDVKPEGSLSIIYDSYDAKPNEDGHQTPNLYPEEMLPVSTLGSISAVKGTGAIKGLKMLRGKLTNSKELSDIIVTSEAFDYLAKPDTNLDLPTYYGYFAFDIFLKNSSKDETKEDVLQLNYDSSLEILEADKSVTGLQNTARVAFAKFGGNLGADDKFEGVVDSFISDQTTILKGTGAYDSTLGGNDVYITDVAIWEPNANDHVQYIVDQQKNTPITWGASDATKYNVYTYDTDADGNPKKGFGMDTAVPTYALKDSAATASPAAKINDIYKWDGNETYLAKQVTLQTSKTSETDYTVQEGVQNLISTSDTGDGTTTFKMAPNSIIRLRVYLWLEGQDVDCINYASHGGGVKVNIGLVKSSPLGQPTEVPEG